jgi:MFS family permease
MAHLTPEDQRGRAGGWFQAGNLGGSGIGGGLGLFLATQLPQPWMSGAALGLAFALCGALMFTLPDVPQEQGKGVVAAVRGVVMELWEVIRTRDGLLAALICFLPIGTGAAGGVIAQAEIAAKWGADETHVGLVRGVLSGVIAALGCLVGGEICRFMSTRTAYASIGVLMALIAAVMGFAPANPTTFVVGGLIYSFATGLAYAAFTGLVLDTIGKGAVATKYNIFASLSNPPITYMGLVLASAATTWGPAGMLYTEAGAGLIAIALFYAVVMAVGARKATG